MENLLNAGVSIQKMAEEFPDLQKLKETQNANSISAHKNKTEVFHTKFSVGTVIVRNHSSQEPFH